MASLPVTVPMPAFNNRKGRQMTINELIEKLVGKPFEIECSEIQVHGMLDHHPPIFRGPGVIRSEAEGRITFRMHNQIEATPEALSSLRWFKKEGGGLEPRNLMDWCLVNPANPSLERFTISHRWEL